MYLKPHDIDGHGLDVLQFLHPVVNLLTEVLEVELQSLTLLKDLLGGVQAGSSDSTQMEEILPEALVAKVPEELDRLVSPGGIDGRVVELEHGIVVMGYVRLLDHLHGWGTLCISKREENAAVKTSTY